MGKEGEEQQPPGEDERGGVAGGGGGGRRWCCRGVVRLQCLAALVLGAAVLLSAVFWLPPFWRGRGSQGPDPGAGFAADIVASFTLQKTVSELRESTSKLELDIYEEIGIPNSTVVVNALQPLGGSNLTNVIFSIVPYPANSSISPTWMSILRSYFMSLVVQQSTLHLTESLFGNSSFFEVLKFPGGITIIPPQTAFLLQKPHASFNFTLNFPIYKVQDKTNELKDQMKAGLLLNSYENLYIKLTNLQGSTVVPPTIVQTSIVIEVGNHQPSLPRMKQLAQTITNSSSGNLGLNHTVFGKVKQISLSSYLRHSLNSEGSFGAPSPAPEPHLDHHSRHHHHHHSREHRKHLAPAPAPAPEHFPVQPHRYKAPPPSGCRYGYINNPKKRTPVAPAAEPVASNDKSAPPTAPRHTISPSPVHHSPNNPNVHDNSPVPSPPVLSKPPLPSLSFTRAHPPGESAARTRTAAGMPSVASAPHSSYATRTPSCHWLLIPLLCILTNLL